MMPESRTVALLTDFGTSDSYVAEMKAVMLSIHRDLRFVDITHDVCPGDIRQAAFLLWRSYRFFPDDTIFLSVVDPGVGTERKILLMDSGRYRFVAPDNGALSMVMREIECDVYNVTNRSYAIDADSATFQGRDVMAPAVAYLASGVEPSQFGPVASEICKLDIATPIRNDVCIEGEIISIDRFGNAITNISTHDLDGFSGERRMSVTFGDTRFDSIEKTYSSVDIGNMVAYIGSCGLLELAVNGGDFADKFNATVGGKVVVIPDGK